MKAVVCGAGRVGYGIARELAAEGNSVTVVDWSQTLIDRVTTDLDVRGIVGHGSHPDTLERAGIADADLLVAVTYSDETNMVACQVAHSIFDTPLKIARVRAQSYLAKSWRDLFARGALPIDVTISPELEVSRAILQRLETPGASATAPFANNRLQVLGLRVDEGSPIAGTNREHLRELFPDLGMDVVGVRRDDTVFIPEERDPLSVGDDAYVAVAGPHVPRVLDVFGHQVQRARRVVIIGAGNIGVYVARALERMAGVRVRVIEADKAQAEKAADSLSRTVVLHGDGLDRRLLREAGVEDAELAICLTNDDKVNLLSAVMAKREGAQRTLCLVNEPGLKDVRTELGIDIMIDPRGVTVSTILQHIRRGRITGLQTLADGQAEALEGVALATSPLVGKSLRDLDLPEDVSVCALVRGEKVYFRRDNVTIETNDRLVVFALKAAVPKVEQLFRVSLEYF
ncbi:potassium transporter peripheral membrane component [Glycocaulis alkaliphilus]|uniref:Trk system potassium uptake protein TrkA n=1 Tax=Glycocaulis alkaliphilus TaxID=1434191 RepID=A0A3T0E9S7_9PROT|nr:Trk system potassium transporter TrkA [Glycocaulis alkaliphilus]AZU04032.1 potassium transporter peripheral membrane component [Glycocaulis alkaliphilus]GGB75247.1 Trk system potassium transport protein TrkA [Glycocaulis alkaliphilus]